MAFEEFRKCVGTDGEVADAVDSASRNDLAGTDLRWNCWELPSSWCSCTTGKMRRSACGGLTPKPMDIQYVLRWRKVCRRRTQQLLLSLAELF